MSQSLDTGTGNDSAESQDDVVDKKTKLWLFGASGLGYHTNGDLRRRLVWLIKSTFKGTGTATGRRESHLAHHW